ncbi:HisA/HisF-related TIM barrel protein [Ignisphaera sp. 4213-co]|uniref:HisA/HisF-related TIM barrel protein n=1 Tax=Ignisphaera cupida TaxID=3050454 RepID=A0ABD4Z708_9CREN|nr:HisA/HisF-related TIM barrel protein [Ignisphaera sp. 4213-co]MDK6028782.1 HisA/HisF-related TIM barrel protein [Ignisphaera sp. 4213-co]
MSLTIIPVLDVMNGVVVHAVAGKRNEYKPLSKSVVANSPNPVDVLNGFSRLGCRNVYIADLDAIMGRGGNRHVIETALSLGFKVFADVGREGISIRDNERIAYVIGTEYLVYPSELGLLRNRVVSLDTKNRMTQFKNVEIGVVQAAKEVCGSGVKMVVVLFLDRVGTSMGIDVEILKSVVDVCKGVDIGVGGGLRELNEISILKSLGVKYAFVATAIHRGLVDKCEF